MENSNVKISAMLNTHSFLLTQLYALMLRNDPESLKTLPKSMIDAAKNRSFSKETDDLETLDLIHTETVKMLENFFQGVERRIQQSQDHNHQQEK